METRRARNKRFIGKTIAVLVHDKSLYIFLPFSANQRREMTKFCVVSPVKYKFLFYKASSSASSSSFHVVDLQRTAKKCTKIYLARAQLLSC